MRKLLVTLALAGTLSVPSVVFAEASWYGKLMIGLDSQDSKVKVVSSASRWGIMGSSELDGGLSAVYQFEQGIDAATASQDTNGRLSYVGLSGGFGTVLLGKINTASGTVRGILDKSWFFGASGHTPRRANNVSYSFSNDLMKAQVDAAYAAPHSRDPKANDLQTVEFGLSVNVGEIGKVGLAHTKDNFVLTCVGVNVVDKACGNFTNIDNPADSDTNDTGWEVTTNTIAAEVSVSDLRVYVGSQKKKSEWTMATSGATDPAADTEQKTTYFGFGGGLGDTGISYLVQWRDVKDSHKPWMVGLYKGLGGGVNLNMEYADNDDDPENPENQTRIALEVNF